VKKLNYKLALMYFLSILFLYPIAAYILMYRMGYLVDKLPHGQFWTYIQIFLSGPAIIILGSLLYLRKEKLIWNKIIGITLVLIGVCWLYILFSDIVKEAA
jgi:hypothetical protein